MAGRAATCGQLSDVLLTKKCVCLSFGAPLCTFFLGDQISAMAFVLNNTVSALMYRFPEMYLVARKADPAPLPKNLHGENN